MNEDRILRLQGNINGVWHNIGIDLSQEEGPIKNRLESVRHILMMGQTPSKEDTEWAWDYAKRLKKYFPDRLVK